MSHSSYILGVDEAGRGAWAGPVVAACVAWSGRCPLHGLADSKQLSALQREQLFHTLHALASHGTIIIGRGIIYHSLIDRLGIREANRQAMEMAIAQVVATCPDMSHTSRLLIDGRDGYAFSSDLHPEYIVRGDTRIRQIMAASIVAKVTRDQIMVEYARIYPGYHFDQHKGYGTSLHQEALRVSGVCHIHRRSYQPIRDRIASEGVSL